MWCPFMTHCRAATPVPKSRPMAGRAMLTTVASSAAIPEPSTLTASTHRPDAEEYERPGASTRSGQGWTGPLCPRSRRYDCMIWNVVVLVKSSMSAAESTPVHLALIGGGEHACVLGDVRRGRALGDGVEVSLDPGPEVLPARHVVGHRVDRLQRLARAGVDVGDVVLVHRAVAAGGEAAAGSADA